VPNNSNRAADCLQHAGECAAEAEAWPTPLRARHFSVWRRGGAAWLETANTQRAWRTSWPIQSPLTCRTAVSQPQLER